MLKPSPPATHQRAWSPFAISAAAHVLIILTAAGLTRHRAAVAEDEQEREESASRRVDMIYVPPCCPGTTPARRGPPDRARRHPQSAGLPSRSRMPLRKQSRPPVRSRRTIIHRGSGEQKVRPRRHGRKEAGRHHGIRGAANLRPAEARHPSGRGAAGSPANGSVDARAHRSVHSRAARAE